MVIKIRGHWDAQHCDLNAVLTDAAGMLIPHFSAPPKTITVRPGTDAPMALFGTDNIIQLTPRGRVWDQYSYQFCHEVCHLLTNHNRLLTSSPTQHFQIDEIVCETAAIYGVIKMGEKWMTNPPFPHWKDYSNNLTKYANNVLQKWAKRPDGLIYGDPLRNAVDRERNGFMATRLLPLLLQHPEYWNATQFYPPATSTVDQFFKAWELLCPDKEAGSALIGVLASEN